MANATPARSTIARPPQPAPKDRRGRAHEVGSALPAGTEVFSADNHISLAADIFHERFPASLRDRAPRVFYRNDAWTLGMGDNEILPPEFTKVLAQYDPLPGSSTRDIGERLAQLASDGVARELAFPNSMLALMSWPDLEVRELCFRIYNEYLAELQDSAPGRFFGVGLVNWWDGAGARSTLEEMCSLGIRTFWLPLKPGKGPDGKALDYNGAAMTGFWEAVEASGIAVSHHIGESALSAPCASNHYLVSMVHNAAPFREMFARYICGGLLDRHPGLRIGWFEGGINWVLPALQDADHMVASYAHLSQTELAHEPRYYWDHHMFSAFMLDPLGLEMAHRIGIDRVMWSSDFPHNESTFGYSHESLAAVVDAVGVDDAVKVVSGNVCDFLGLTPQR